MSKLEVDTGEDGITFTERVDMTTQPDGAFIGTLEIEVRASDRHEEQVQALQDECDRLRDRVAELEAQLRDAVIQRAD